MTFITTMICLRRRWRSILIAVLWIIPFTLRAIYLLNGGCCRAAHAYPFLAPLVSTVTMWIIASRSMLQGIGADGTPQKVAWLVTLGGPITITILSLVEVARLKQHPGWPFRDARCRLRPRPRLITAPCDNEAVFIGSTVRSCSLWMLGDLRLS